MISCNSRFYKQTRFLWSLLYKRGQEEWTGWLGKDSETFPVKCVKKVTLDLRRAVKRPKENFSKKCSAISRQKLSSKHYLQNFFSMEFLLYALLCILFIVVQNHILFYCLWRCLSTRTMKTRKRARKGGKNEFSTVFFSYLIWS